jgi:hypothetical protein
VHITCLTSDKNLINFHMPEAFSKAGLHRRRAGLLAGMGYFGAQECANNAENNAANTRGIAEP